MPRLPRVSGREVIKALERIGFRQTRQRGSYAVMRRGDRGCTVPLHRELRLCTWSAMLTQAGVPIDELLNALR